MEQNKPSDSIRKEFRPLRGPGPKLELPHIKNIIAVASGKGGVGKSTVAANLAAALTAVPDHLAQQNLRIGLLDADIYGPSQSRMMGLTGQRARAEDGKLIPLTAYGMKIISMAMLADENAPMIWRGPMIQTAFTQMLKDVAWGELDVLMIDLPPGTGDVQLSLAQKVDARGAVIVSTPQDIALIDARKAVAMFEKMNTPILGMIENMSFYCCPECGHHAEIFNTGGAAQAADKLGIPFLGAVPLDAAVCETSEAGTPIVLAQPDSNPAQVFTAAARHIYGQITRNAAA